MSTKAPRKYLDADRTQVNPDWLAWRQTIVDDALETAPAHLVNLGIAPEMYFPEDKLISEEGAWVLVLEEPYTELKQRFTVPLLSMWRARHHQLNSGGMNIGSRRSPLVIRPHQAVIVTPGGELHLWPHEYSVVNSPYELMSCEGAEIHSLGGEPVLDEDQLFYLGSRGIPHFEVVQLLISQVQSQDFIYVTFPEEITSTLQGVGQPLWRHIQRSRYRIETTRTTS